MAVVEMFYNPWTKDNFKVSGYRKVLNSTQSAHDDHLHVASDNADEMKKIIDTAATYNLKTSENPYAKNDPTGKVDPVHTEHSWHYVPLNTDFTVGGAVDITGRHDDIVKFITLYLVNDLGAGGNAKYPAKDSKELNKLKDVYTKIADEIKRKFPDGVIDEVKKKEFAKYLKEKFPTLLGNLTEEQVIIYINNSLKYIKFFAIGAGVYYATQSDSHNPDYFTPSAIYQRLQSQQNESVVKEEISRIKNLMK